MTERIAGRREFLTALGATGAAATQSLAAFGQAVENARQDSNQDIWGCGEAVDAVRGTYHLVPTSRETPHG